MRLPSQPRRDLTRAFLSSGPHPQAVESLLRNQNSANFRFRSKSAVINNFASVQTRVPGGRLITFSYIDLQAWSRLACRRFGRVWALRGRRNAEAGCASSKTICSTLGCESPFSARASLISAVAGRTKNDLVGYRRRWLYLSPGLVNGALGFRRPSGCCRRGIAQGERLGAAAERGRADRRLCRIAAAERNCRRPSRCLGAYRPTMGVVDRGLSRMALRSFVAAANRAIRSRTNNLHFGVAHCARRLSRRAAAGAFPRNTGGLE